MFDYGLLTAESFILPDWPAPKNVEAYTTTRIGGISQGHYQGLNLGLHVGDSPSAVQTNRKLLPNFEKVNWLKQTHSTKCIDLSELETVTAGEIEGDASFTHAPKQVCAVMTADCLPLLVCDLAGTKVAAIHAGWRGLADGVIENCINNMGIKPQDLMVWLGPALSQPHFEVASDVKQVVNAYPEAFDKNTKSTAEKYYFDMLGVARAKLHALGVEQIYGGDHCTYAEDNLFYSHRRATHIAARTNIFPVATGRMVSAIYLT